MRRLALLLTLLAPLLAAPLGLRDPIQVRIEGFLGAGEEVKPWEVLDVQIGSDPPRKFAMTNIIVLSVGTVMGADILQAVEPIHPNFIWNGDEKQLREVHIRVVSPPKS